MPTLNTPPPQTHQFLPHTLWWEKIHKKTLNCYQNMQNFTEFSTNAIMAKIADQIETSVVLVLAVKIPQIPSDV